MDTHTPQPQPRDYRFAIGLLAGTAIGAALALWLAPRAAAEIRGRIKDSTRSLGRQASDHYDKAAAKISEVVDGVTQTGQGIRDQAADVVARGAHQVESFAKSVKSA